MFSDNLLYLRNLKGLSQEQVAEAVGISRQSYSKWEQGDTFPDIDKCDKLAKFYGVTIDSLIHSDEKIGKTKIAPAPIGKHLWGTVTIGSKGQIVIPKNARDTFDMKEGDRLVVLGDESQGIALIKTEIFENQMQEMLERSQRSAE
ncbi:helix-turn-helix domain-containing protein [uncultured Eubacterium sp.]|uniref:helix-turn-helix domain-containing protein n=1 Tax=uncultured Eubacterium sp. TaxID=165185 RepID=UPI0025D29908|nr:helix-turn-helix domain-containing protein [uncultured Eubacterium sp.]